MKNDKFVIINGQKYDTATGLPVAKSNTQPKPIHSVAQRASSSRATVAKPVESPRVSTVRKAGRNMDVSRSKKIAHFAPKKTAPAVVKTSPTKRKMDIGPIKHPIAARVESARVVQKSKNAVIQKPAKVLKDEAIAKALNSPAEKPTRRKNIFSRHNRLINVFSLSLVLLIVAGYFTYLNMPSLSVRVASAQAGINATYPDYHPDGYSLDGPVVYSDGQVSINFHANTGDRSFVIKQAKSSWDSSAVKSQIDKESNGGTSEAQERGLTIFSYDNNTKAAWVNGGILYSITGNAPLSGEQIRHIATSLIDR